MASYACAEGGTIILVAECAEGLGRADFLKWFDARDSGELELRLRDAYEVNGQTAWSLLTKAERFRIHLVSNLPAEDVRRLRLIPSPSVEEALAQADGEADGYVMPAGATLMPVLNG
jgi:nickel-dependent lactate racemase